MKVDTTNVRAAGSLEEIRSEILVAEKRTIRWWGQYLVVKLIVFFANIVLCIFRRLLFRWNRPSNQVKEIVAYTVGIVGDNVVMLPAVTALRRRWPDSEITVISNCQTWSPEGARSVFGNSPWVDRIEVVTQHPIQRRGLQLVLATPELADIRCDLFVNLSPFGNRGLVGAVMREMILARRLRAKWAVGFRLGTYNRRQRFNRVQVWFMENEPRRWLKAIGELGLSAIETQDYFKQDGAAHDSVLAKLRQGGWTEDRPLFVINPGAKFPEKCWPVDRFGAVAQWLGEHYGALAVVTGIQQESPLAEAVVEASGDRAISLTGQTNLAELMALLRMARGCITNDTGTMHLAAMAGIPIVALFATRISPWHWFPVSSNVRALFNMRECRCHQIEECRSMDCMRSITVEDAIGALREVLPEPLLPAIAGAQS